MLEDRFPRIWVPDAENRDLRQLLWDRHRMVQMRTRIMNQLHVVALNERVRRKKALWRPVARNWNRSHLPQGGAPAAGPAGVIRPTHTEDPGAHPRVGRGSGNASGDAAVDDASRSWSTNRLAYELVNGTPERFHCDKQIASNVGLVPEEKSCGDRRRLGNISKQGTCCCGFYWSRRRRSRCAVKPNGAVGSSTWPCGASERLPR